MKSLDKVKIMTKCRI